jgi:hypothetical protein
VFHIVLEVALKYWSALEYYLAFAFLFALQPLPFVCGVVNVVLSLTVAQSVFDLSLVCAAIGPLVVAFAGDAVVGELSLVGDAVGPREYALSVQ